MPDIKYNADIFFSDFTFLHYKISDLKSES